MATLDSFMFQLGVVLLLAFIAAAISFRLKLSAIVGYMIVGIMIGPHITFSLGPFQYSGLVTDTTFLATMSQLGLILLLFFVGLEFPMSRLRRTGRASLVMAFINLSLNMFGGMLLGLYLDWPLIDTVFLAGVISMSSSSVTAKSLMDLKKLGEKDTDFLLGMVILESFMAMFLLTAVNGMVLHDGGEARSLWSVLLGIGIFVGFFAFLAVGVIPRVASLFKHMESDELFILSALGIVMLSAALAEAFYIPSVIGAFFIGMSFAETNLHDRLSSKMESLRDAFVAFFFLSFGMGLDPALFPVVLPIVLIAVPLILLNDYFLTAVLAYAMGFRPSAALDISAGLVGRNEEAVLYASVGSRALVSNPSLDQSAGARLLDPVAGLVCMSTSVLAPILMKRSTPAAKLFRRILPQSWRLGGEVVRQDLRAFFLPPTIKVQKRHWGLSASLVIAVAHGVALMALSGPLHVVLGLALPVTLSVVALALAAALGDPPGMVWPQGYPLGIPGRQARRLVVSLVVGAVAVGLAILALWPYVWWAPFGPPLAYLLWASTLMVRTRKLGYSRAVQRVATDGGGGPSG